MPAIYSQTVTRLRATRLRDSGGTLTPQSDWAHATSVDIPGVSIQPVATTETRDDAGILTTDEWRLFTRRGYTVDIQAGDRVIWAGRTLDVVGGPQTWPGVLAGSHHTEIALKASPPTVLGATGAPALLRQAEAGGYATQQTWTP